MKVLLKRPEFGLRPLSSLTVTAIALFWVLALGVADYYTPGSMSFVLFYMLAVIFAGWGAGKWHAWFVSWVALLTMVTVHWVLHRAVAQPFWIAVWNHSTRFLVFSVTGWLTAEMVSLVRHLADRVEQQTDQWQKEAEEHKVTSSRLSESLERFEQVVHNITEVFWLVDVAKSQVVYISPGYEELWGRKCEELYRAPESWLAAVHPADRDTVSRRSYSDPAAGGYDVDYRIVRPDGTVRWIRDRAFPVRNRQGEVYRVAGIAEDITERRQAEQALRQNEESLRVFLDAVPLPAFLLDREGTIIVGNRALASRLSIPEGALRGKNAFGLIPAKVAESRKVMFDQVIRNREPVRFEDESMGRHYINFFSPVLDAAGNVSRVAIFGLDMTERNRAVLTKEAFLSLGTKLNAASSPIEAARAIYASADLLWKWDSGTLDVYSPETDRMQSVLNCDLLDGQRREVSSNRSSGAPTPRMQRIMQEGPQLILREPPYGPTGDTVMFGDVARPSASIMCVPLRQEGQPVGVLSIQSYKPNAYSREDLQTLQALADHCGGALERLRAEEARRQSEESNRSILATAMDGYYAADFSADPRGAIIDVNEAYCRMTGYSRQELLRLRIADLEAIESPEDFAQHAQKLISARVDRFETRHRRKDGQAFDVEISLSLLTGRDQYFFGFVRDITERKRADRAKEALLSLGTKLSEVASPLAAGRAVFATADQLWQWDVAVLKLHSVERDSMHSVLLIDVVDGERREIPPPSPDRPPPPLMRRIMQNGPELILRTPADTQRNGFEAFGDVARLSASLMYAPLRREGKAVGVLSIQSYAFNAYTPEDLRTLQALADYCGGALDRIQAEVALREGRDKLEQRVQERTAELQAANAALRTSEEKYRRLHETMTDAFVSVEMGGRITEFNRAYLALFGYTEDELRQLTNVDITPKKWHAFEARLVAEQILPRGYSEVYEKEYRRKDGTTFPVELHTFLLRDANGQPAGMWAIVRDITERKRVAEALQAAHDKLEQRVRERTAELEATNVALSESEERYRSLVNNLNVGVYRNRPGLRGTFVQANPALARMHGYESLDEFQKVKVADLYQDPCEREAFLAEVCRKGMLLNYELRLKKKDGTPIYGSVNATVHQDRNGEVEWIDGVLEDITDRKRAERQLAEALDLNQKMLTAATMGIAAYKASGECVFANEALARSVGGSLNEVLQGNFRRVEAWRQSGLLQMADEALDQGQASSGEVFCETRFGKSVWLDCHMARFVSNGQPHLLLMARDVTERKQAESLLQAQRDLGVSLSLTSDLATALKRLLDITMQIGGVDAGGAYLLNERSGGMDLIVHHGGSPAFVKAVSYWAPASPQIRLMQRGKPIFTTYGKLPFPLDETRRREGMRATALIPLCHERKAIGAIGLSSRVTDEIPRQTQLVIEALAAQATGAIARIRAEAEQHRLERQLLEITDREQARIGQDIHDGLCQHLVSLAFDANSLARELSSQRRAQAPTARRMAELLDQTITETRQLARGLFPVRLESEGLPSALEELARSTRDRFKIHCRFRSKGAVTVPSSTVATHLYRIAQEAVANAVKHSGARRISIDLKAQENQLRLKVGDDGRGMRTKASKAEDGMGLHIMDYRARSIGGRLRVTSLPRGGTQVFCCVPRQLR